jgi:iron complex outermembrane receptor protein
VGGVTGFFNDYDDLRSQERLPAQGLIVLSNGLRGHTYGLEAAAAYDVLPWWRLRAAYSHLQKHLEPKPGSTDITGGRSEGIDPRNQFQFRSQMDLPYRTELDFWFRHVSSLLVSAPALPVPAYTVFDVRLGWNPAEEIEFSVVGRNLPSRRHAEFGPNGQLVGRELYGILTWRF